MADNEFEELYSNCKNAVQRYVFYKVPIKHDGEDVLQETLFIAYQKFNQLRDKTKFKPWLLSIATNVCNSYYRNKIKSIEIPLEDVYSYELISSKDGKTINETVTKHLIR